MQMKTTVLGIIAAAALLTSTASHAGGNVTWSLSVNLGHGHPGYALNIAPNYHHGGHHRPQQVWHRPVHRPIQQVVYGRPHRHGNNWCRVVHVDNRGHGRRHRTHRHH